MAKKYYVCTSALPNRVICADGKEINELKKDGSIKQITEPELKSLKNEIKAGYWTTVKTPEEGFMLPCFFNTDFCT